MDFSAALTADITNLCLHLGLDPDAITTPLEALHQNLASAVASYVGLQLDLTDVDQLITVSAYRTEADLTAISSSLHLPLAVFPLSAGVADPARAITFYAATAGAFVDLAADLSFALQLSGPHLPTGPHVRSETTADEAGVRVVLDQHLTPRATESGVVGASEASVVNRAVGYLIGEGYHPDDAADELARRATAAGVGVVTYAIQLIRSSAD